MLEINASCSYPEFTLSIQAKLPLHGITTIFGNSAAGKSTLLNMIAGFIPTHTNSHIQFGEHIWQKRDGRSTPIHKRGIAYITQQNSLFEHLTVQQNLDFAKKRRHSDRHINEADIFEVLQIQSIINKYPQQLSGGEKQRAAIARAFFSRPQLILLDEPLNALDISNQQQLTHYLKTLQQETNIPFLYVTHNHHEVMQLSDTTLLLEKGQLKKVLPTQDFFNDLHNPIYTPPASTNAKSYQPLATIEPAVIFDGKVSKIDQRYGLLTIKIPHTQSSLSSDHCLELHAANTDEASIGDTLRIRIYAKDISLNLQKPEQCSILNCLPATVVEMRSNNHFQVIVKLECAGHSLLASITQKSAVDLNITPGQQLYAQIKGIAILSS